MQVTYRELPSKRRFGVELEMSNKVSKQTIGEMLVGYENGTHEVRVTSGVKGWAETCRNAYWHVKYDSTCGHKGKGKDSGWEVASYIGRGVRDISRIAGAAQLLGDKGLTTTRNCGLHIHVETDDFTQRDMGCLLAHWIKAENYLLHLCPIRRHENKYCRTLRSRYNDSPIFYQRSDLSQFWLQMAPAQLHPHNNPEKKYTLNTVGYALGCILGYYDRKTVELRLPECVLERKHVENWIRLMVHFVDFCKNRSAPVNLESACSTIDFLRIVGLHGDSSDFPILERKLLDTKVWVLRKLLKSTTIPCHAHSQANDLLAFILRI